MEEQVLKVAAQLGLIVVILIALSWGTGQTTAKQANAQSDPCNRKGRKQPGKGYIWQHSPVQAPAVEDALSWGPSPLFS